MKDVRKDIIFRDGDYNEKFRIKDGESIKVTLANPFPGEPDVVTRKCRWIDETHTKIGSEHWHNDEYAEKSARVGNKIEPLPSFEPTIDILTAEYGEELRHIEIPMTEEAVKELVGPKLFKHYHGDEYVLEPLYVDGQGVNGEYGQRINAMIVRGHDAIAVCGVGGDGNTLTSLHPYSEQTYKRELSPVAPRWTVKPIENRHDVLKGNPRYDRISKSVTERNEVLYGVWDNTFGKWLKNIDDYVAFGDEPAMRRSAARLNPKAASEKSSVEPELGTDVAQLSDEERELQEIREESDQKDWLAMMGREPWDEPMTSKEWEEMREFEQEEKHRAEVYKAMTPEEYRIMMFIEHGKDFYPELGQFPLNTPSWEEIWDRAEDRVTVGRAAREAARSDGKQRGEPTLRGITEKFAAAKAEAERLNGERSGESETKKKSAPER
jgi:hypothetical protein